MSAITDQFHVTWSEEISSFYVTITKRKQVGYLR